MSVKVQNLEAQSKPSVLSDPGNMLIICYVAVVLLFLLIGGLGAVKYSSDSNTAPSTVSTEIHQVFFKMI